LPFPSSPHCPPIIAITGIIPPCKLSFYLTPQTALQIKITHLDFATLD